MRPKASRKSNRSCGSMLLGSEDLGSPIAPALHPVAHIYSWAGSILCLQLSSFNILWSSFQPRLHPHRFMKWPSRCPCRKSNPATHCPAWGTLWNHGTRLSDIFHLQRWPCRVLSSAAPHPSNSNLWPLWWLNGKITFLALIWEQEIPAVALSLWAFSFLGWPKFAFL